MLDNLDNLYENIGGKIKNWAKWIFIVEAIGAVIGGIVYFVENDLDDGWIGVLIIFLGPVAAWVSSWLLYAFGELVENSGIAKEKLTLLLINSDNASQKEKRKSDSNNGSTSAPQNEAAHKFRCDGCGKMRTQTPCEHCGKN